MRALRAKTDGFAGAADFTVESMDTTTSTCAASYEYRTTTSNIWRMSECHVSAAEECDALLGTSRDSCLVRKVKFLSATERCRRDVSCGEDAAEA